MLVLVNGEYVVLEKVQHEILESPIEVYNFQVEDDHTYYVGESGVLVHNACDNVPTRELTPTHQLTKSRKDMINLVDDVRVNGIQDPIKYVKYRGGKYVVDGHHRLAAAKRLNMNCVPATEVSLPYAGYKTIDDLLW